jgi:hypothetical protein
MMFGRTLTGSAGLVPNGDRARCWSNDAGCGGKFRQRRFRRRHEEKLRARRHEGDVRGRRSHTDIGRGGSVARILSPSDRVRPIIIENLGKVEKRTQRDLVLNAGIMVASNSFDAIYDETTEKLQIAKEMGLMKVLMLVTASSLR